MNRTILGAALVAAFMTAGAAPAANTLTTTTPVQAGLPPLISALTVTLDFSAGATITTCGESLDALLGPLPLIATGIAGTVATIGAIDAQGIDASAGLEYVWCSATGASVAGDYVLAITEARDTTFADISGNVSVTVSSTTGGCHPSADADDVCLTVTTPAVACGDPTEDGEITAADALLALQAAVGLTVCDLSRCDTNADGQVTALDALKLLQYAVGLDVVLNCEVVPPTSTSTTYTSTTTTSTTSTTTTTVPVVLPELKVTKKGSGSGTVTSTPLGIDCGADCDERYSKGTQVTLRPTPTTGSEFTGWEQRCAGSPVLCVLTMNQNKQARAIFELITTTTTSTTLPPVVNVQLKVIPVGTGTGKIVASIGGIDCGESAWYLNEPLGTTCSADYVKGTPVTLTASAAVGSDFVRWKLGCTGTSTCSPNLNRNRTVKAVFDLTYPNYNPQPPVGSGYAETIVPCRVAGFGNKIDIWSFNAQAGTHYTVRANTTNPDTAAEMLERVYAESDSTSFRSFHFPYVDCSFAPPNGAPCPVIDFVAPTTERYFIDLETYGESAGCSNFNIADYRLHVIGNGQAVPLILQVDDGPGGGGASACQSFYAGLQACGIIDEVGSNDCYWMNDAVAECLESCPDQDTCAGMSEFMCALPDNADSAACLEDCFFIASFQCDDGSETSLGYVCDGDLDCNDGSDEVGCPNNFACAAKAYSPYYPDAIPASWVCDGDLDCTDGSDEVGCSSLNCGGGGASACQTFFAGLQACGIINEVGSNQCYRMNDAVAECLESCPDQDTCAGMSEFMCALPFNADSAACLEDCFFIASFQCDDGSETSLGYVCDGDLDCNDGSDEVGCPGPFACEPSGLFDSPFPDAIPASWVCDGDLDCTDGSDEVGCGSLNCGDRKGDSASQAVFSLGGRNKK